MKRAGLTPERTKATSRATAVKPFKSFVRSIAGSVGQEEATQVFFKLIERAARLLSPAGGQHELHCEAAMSIACNVGSVPETLGCWVRQKERDIGPHPRLTAAEVRLQRLEGELRKTIRS